eukprot:15338275-Ditylum_brightwellii.AAC.1
MKWICLVDVPADKLSSDRITLCCAIQWKCYNYRYSSTAIETALLPPPVQQYTGVAVQRLPTVGPCAMIPGSTDIPPNATAVHIIRRPTARVDPLFSITPLPKSMVELYNQHHCHALSNLDRVSKMH